MCAAYVQCAIKLNKAVSGLQQLGQLRGQLFEYRLIIDWRTNPGNI